MKFIKYLPALFAVVITGSVALISASAEETVTTAITEPAVTTSVTALSEPTVTTTVATSLLQPATTAVSTAAQNTTAVGTTVTVPSTTTVTITAAHAPGWYHSDDGKVYFYGEKGNKYTGLRKIDGNVYYFSRSGAMKTGWLTVDGIRMFFDFETGVRKNGWIDYMNETYYSDEKLGKLTGVQEIDGETYIFSEKGILYKNWYEYEGGKYYGGEDGALRKGRCKIDGVTYVFSKTGKFQSGWQTVNNKRLFYDYDTAKILNGWIHYNGLIYYSDEKSGKLKGDHIIDGAPYRFAEKGFLELGFQVFKEGTRYYNTDGTPGIGFVTVNGSIYYFDKKGYMQTGFQALDGMIYYFEPESGRMLCGWHTIDNKKYYFDKDGKMVTGLNVIGTKVYFFDESGVMLKGWKTIENRKYYFSDEGAAVTGWYTIDGKKYYFNEKGAMATEFRTIDKNMYYFGSDGAMKTGWQTVKNKKYYFDVKNGAAYTYRHNIDNKNYCFYSDGVMIENGNQDIVAKALTQLGNVGGRPYWTWWGFNYRIEWCACFVSWCANQCGFTANGSVPEFISCAVGISWFINHGQWKNKFSYTPTSGDYIFFDWEPDGVADHIGIVDYCEIGIVYTVEGNRGDVCCKWSYDLNDPCIFGFARPAFQP